MTFCKPSTLEITAVALCGDFATSPVGASHFLSDPDRTALEPSVVTNGDLSLTANEASAEEIKT